MCEYALSLREHLSSKSYDFSMGEDGKHELNDILHEANLSVESLHVQNEVNLFCHACDFSFLAVHNNDPAISSAYNKHFNSVMRFLSE